MTPRQLQVFDFVRERLDQLGTGPTYQAIADQFRITKSNAFAIVAKLIDAGHLGLERPRGSKANRTLRLANVPDIRHVPTSRLESELARRGITLDALHSGARKAFARGAVTCGAECCDVEVPRGRLFCLTHWRAIPYDLQQAILAAHRRGDVSEYQDRVAEARDVIAGFGRW